MENKEVKAENTAKPADPDDIYATLDWDTNPVSYTHLLRGLDAEADGTARPSGRTAAGDEG